MTPGTLEGRSEQAQSRPQPPKGNIYRAVVGSLFRGTLRIIDAVAGAHIGGDGVARLWMSNDDVGDLTGTWFDLQVSEADNFTFMEMQTSDEWYILQSCDTGYAEMEIGNTDGVTNKAFIFMEADINNVTLQISADATQSQDMVSIIDGGSTKRLFVRKDASLAFVEFAADPAAPAANQVVLFAKDNGAGKTQLCARFNTGATQVIATQP